MRSLSGICLPLLLLATPSLAARSFHAPVVQWHNWIATGANAAFPGPPWCADLPTVRGYAAGVEINVTNVSSLKQTLNLTIKPFAVDSASSSNPTQKLATAWQFSGNYSTPIGSAQTPGANGAGAGDWHIMGAMDIVFGIAEDRGAISATIQTANENSCANMDNSQVTGMFRNITKVYAVNGGRPF